ncbi:MAG: Flp family type IVb pilin [Isosphaerales bacterium]
MSRIIPRIRQFLASEDAPTAAEYAVMLVFIVPVVIVVITAIGTTVCGTFSSAGSVFGGGS